MCPDYLKLTVTKHRKQNKWNLYASPLMAFIVSKALHITSLNVKHKETRITLHYFCCSESWRQKRKSACKQRERKGGKVVKSACRLTCSMSQLCPTFWLRLEIHQSASNAGSTAKMKESLEAVAEGRKTHVCTILNECTHACERAAKTEKRRRYQDARALVCVFVCVLAHYCLLGQSGLIRFWKQITSANHSIKPTRGLGHYLEYSTTFFSLLRMKRNCGQQGNSMKL